MKTSNCPYCNEEIKHGNAWHVRKCMINFINNELDKEEMIKLYLDDKKSCVQLSEIYKLPYTQIVSILSFLGVKLRKIKEACSTVEKKNKYENTMNDKYGVKHNFIKNAESRRKWEERLLKEEGITNVFQRKDVKEKILKTMLEKYGIDGIKYNRGKANYLSYYIEKYGEEEGVIRYNKLSKEKGKANYLSYYIEKYGEEEGVIRYEQRLKSIAKCFKHNDNLNKKCALILDKLSIKYETEYVIRVNDSKYYRYDFKIGNLILELNGTYWHCSPKKYKPNDLVKFPGNNFIIAKDKWEYDTIKMSCASEKGFDTATIWEENFSEENLISILKKHNYGNC